MKLHKGDTVKVVTGKENGKTGKIERVFAKESKVLVEGLNQVKRHMKARSQTQPAEIVMLTKPLAVANVALMCPHCKQPTRVGYVTEKGVKSRMCRKCDKKI
jgi:large subunit ribosomal protein L24